MRTPTTLQPESARNGRAEDRGVLALYQRMQSRGVKPSLSIVLAALKVCRNTRDLEHGRRIHREAVKSGEHTNIIVCNILVDMYAKCKSMEEAQSVFQSMRNRDAISWNSIIQGYAQTGHGDLALSLYSRMQDEPGCRPGRVSLLAALKACSDLADKETGTTVKETDKVVKVRCLHRCKLVHSDAARFGYDSDLFVASRLVDLYSRCGDTSSALQVFSGMEEKSVVTWNSLILGHANCGEGVEALEFFSAMHETGCCSPDAGTFVAALKACGSLGERAQAGTLRCLEMCKALHAQAVESGYHTDIFVANSLIDVYSKLRCMSESRQVFEGIRKRDVVSWNSIILGYAENGEGRVALELYFRMEQEGLTPDRVTILAALKACACAAESEQGTEMLHLGEALHADARKLVPKLDLFIENALVDMYVKCGSMEKAWNVLRSMERRDVISWTGIILGYGQRGEHKRVLASFAQMQEDGVTPDHVTATTALKACASLADKEEGRRIRGRVVKVQCLEKGRSLHSQVAQLSCSSVYLGCALVDLYAKCGSMSDASCVFEAVKNPDLVLWNCLILGHANCGENDKALEAYARMRGEGLVAPDSGTYVAVLKACAALAALETGKKLHGEIRSAGLHADSTLGSSLVSFYGKCGCMNEAEEAFEAIREKTVVAWSALMAGYSAQGDWGRVLDVFQRTRTEKVRPDSVMFLCLLSACSHAGLVDEAKELFQGMTKEYGIVPSIEHYTCLVDLLGRSNQLHEAVRLMKALPVEADVIVWTTVLDACRRWKGEAVGRLAFETLMKIDDRGW